jgi:hypothetical protein
MDKAQIAQSGDTMLQLSGAKVSVIDAIERTSSLP